LEVLPEGVLVEFTDENIKNLMKDSPLLGSALLLFPEESRYGLFQTEQSSRCYSPGHLSPW